MFVMDPPIYFLKRYRYVYLLTGTSPTPSVGRSSLVKSLLLVIANGGKPLDPVRTRHDFLPSAFLAVGVEYPAAPLKELNGVRGKVEGSTLFQHAFQSHQRILLDDPELFMMILLKWIWKWQNDCRQGMRWDQIEEFDAISTVDAHIIIR